MTIEASPFCEPKFSDPDAKKQTFLLFFFLLTGIHLQKESCPQQAAFWGRSPIRVLTDLDLA